MSQFTLSQYYGRATAAMLAFYSRTGWRNGYDNGYLSNAAQLQAVAGGKAVVTITQGEQKNPARVFIFTFADDRFQLRIEHLTYIKNGYKHEFHVLCDFDADMTLHFIPVSVEFTQVEAMRPAERREFLAQFNDYFESLM